MINFDSLSLNKWIEQNKDFLQGGRIQKIQQPTRRDFVFTIRKNGNLKKLYININPKYYHVCFMNKESEEKRLIEIPQNPPMFCMQLRKYLENSFISKINQPKYERILEFYIETYNELSEKIYLCLAIEFMGKHSNVILYNYDTNIILGCAHNVGSEKSRERELAGTLPYTYPPNPPKMWYEAHESFANSKDINSDIDDYYAEIIHQDKISLLKSKLKQIVSKKLKKSENSLEKINYKLSKDDDDYRYKADMIMANLYNNKDYSDHIRVFDYVNNKEINIELDKTKTLKENANSFYKIYNKSKASKEKIKELAENLNEEINYLEHVLYSIEIADSIDELQQIEFEIVPEKKQSQKNKNSYEPMEILVENCKVFVGKNNRQNDYIVSKLSKDEDLWFHTKDCAGSHVLLKSYDISDKLIYECAKLAKKYSKASQSAKAGVIYTKRKYLKKPPKANLGYVIYKNEQEITIG